MAAVRDTLTFLGQCAIRFRQTGAVVPSGGPLARAMVTAIGHLEPGQVVIELGPGTGVFTRELRQRFGFTRHDAPNGSTIVCNSA